MPGGQLCRHAAGVERQHEPGLRVAGDSRAGASLFKRSVATADLPHYAFLTAVWPSLLCPQILERHVEDALTLLPVIEDAVGRDSESAALRLVDVGSGAGFPGMVLAIARPRWKITLVDSMAKVHTRSRACMLGIAPTRVL